MDDINYDDLRAKLIRFYEKHSPGAKTPEDIEKVVELVQKTDITEHELFTQLCGKYNVLYDPLDWKKPVIGKGTINGAQVVTKGGDTTTKVASNTTPPVMATNLPVLSTREIKPRGQNPKSPVGSPCAGRRSTFGPQQTPVDFIARRKRLVQFYELYNPEKLGTVDTIMNLARESGWTEIELFTNLSQKYNLPTKSVFEKLKLKSHTDPTVGDGHGHALADAALRDALEQVLKEEFVEWVNKTIVLKPLLTVPQLGERLSDGVILCQLLQTLDSAVRFRYHAKTANRFQKLANVETFLKHAVKMFDIGKDDLFDPADVVSGEHTKQVMSVFLYVAKAAHEIYQSYAPEIVTMEMEIEKTEAELTNEEVTRLLAAQQQEVQEKLNEAEIKRREEEAERIRKETEEKERMEAWKEMERRKIREEERRRFEEETKRREEQAEALRVMKRFEEEKRIQQEQELRQAAYMRQREKHEAEARQREQERRAAAHAKDYSEDRPIFQYRVKDGQNRYIGDRNDTIDVAVGRIVNGLPMCVPAVKIRKLKSGMYGIEYPKRLVFHVRVIRDCVVIRVGGGWESLEEYLRRRLRDYPEVIEKVDFTKDLIGTQRITMLHKSKPAMKF